MITIYKSLDKIDIPVLFINSRDDPICLIDYIPI